MLLHRLWLQPRLHPLRQCDTELDSVLTAQHVTQCHESVLLGKINQCSHGDSYYRAQVLQMSHVKDEYLSHVC